MQKIVINACHGGFGVSEAGIKEYLRRKGIVTYPETLTYSTVWWLVPPEERTLWSKTTPKERMSLGFRADPHDSAYKTDPSLVWNGVIKRGDPVLVAVVEDMGDAASGEYAELKVVEIPDGVEWRIEEYDGWEWVAEEHRTWG